MLVVRVELHLVAAGVECAEEERGAEHAERRVAAEERDDDRVEADGPAVGASVR